MGVENTPIILKLFFGCTLCAAVKSSVSLSSGFLIGKCMMCTFVC